VTTIKTSQSVTDQNTLLTSKITAWTLPRS